MSTMEYHYGYAREVHGEKPFKEINKERAIELQRKYYPNNSLEGIFPDIDVDFDEKVAVWNEYFYDIEFNGQLRQFVIEETHPLAQDGDDFFFGEYTGIMQLKNNDNIDRIFFAISYYNGGCSFREAVEEAILDGLQKRQNYVEEQMSKR